MWSFQVRVIGLAGIRWKKLILGFLYVNALWNIKNCGELARVSDFLPNFLFIKILRKKISADFLAAIFPNHL